MTIRATCPRCDKEITSRDEDELVAKVQAHARDDHHLTHVLPPRHILANLHRQEASDH